jgi:hypothetical protein
MKMRSKKNLCLAVVLIGAVSFVFPGCSGESAEEPEDVEMDVGDEEEDAEEDGEEVEEGLRRVELDLDEHFDAPGQGFVRAAQVVTEEELIAGEVAQGIVGDWLLENDRGRYLIGFGEKAIGPCSWDGNPIEVESVRDEERRGSVLGEICLLLNVGQTMKPEIVEILEDGEEGRAIVAVTGVPAALDFLNLRAMVDGFAPGLLDMLDFDPDRPLPFTITVYYVLTPESRSMRVLTAVRNDGEEKEYFIGAQLVLSGSTGSYFTPLGRQKGWGYASLGVDNLRADPVSYLGYIARHSGYAVVPDPVEHMENDLPVGAGMLAVSGAAGLVYGATDLLGTLTARRNVWANTPGYIGVDPGGVATLGYRLYPSPSGNLSDVTGDIFADLGVETRQIEGQVLDAGGEPREGVKVAFLKDGDRTYTGGWTDAQGRFAAELPPGSWEVRFRDDGVLTRVQGVELGEEDLDLGEVELVEAAVVTVRVRTPEGAVTPARLVISCAGDCGERRQDSRELDPLVQPPGSWLRIEEIGVSGETTFLMAEGSYRFAVNRGMTWSVWPEDATTTGGELIALNWGQELELEVEIAEVIDTTGTLSSDFHIHAMASPDSQVSDQQRVLDFLAGGLDVMVSSDHDAVVDFAPAIRALGAEGFIASVVGTEITASNLGHINAFPIEVDESARRGGPLDWSNDGGENLILQEVIDAVRLHPGEQIIQLNHPRVPTGAIGNLQVDPLTGQSFADPAAMRMPADFVDPITGDTGLWSEEFDALEVYNGFSLGAFWAVFRWWLAMIGRGFAPTGTAVSDTHGLYYSLGASPRSFIFVDVDKDTPSTLEVEHFVERIRAGALVGTNGPFMRVWAENGAGARADLGEVLDASEGAVTLKIAIEVPDWIDVDTLQIFMNMDAEELLPGAPGQAIDDRLEPTMELSVSWNAQEHRELVATGAREHYRWRQVVEVPLEIEEDSYVVVLARGINGRSMRPVIANPALPFAFSNPLFFDFDGNGYDNPPLKNAREERLALSRELRMRAMELESRELIIAPGEELTEENLGRLLEALRCNHGDGQTHVHGHHHDHSQGHSHPHPHGHSHGGRHHHHHH